jgi:hypothetical protein
VKPNTPVCVEDAEIHGPGVEVNATVELMLTLVESHTWSPSKR